MRRIGVATFARSDYSSCLPVLRRIRDDGDLELVLIVGGTHLDPEYGSTVDEIEDEGFPIAARVHYLPSTDSARAAAEALGAAACGIAQALDDVRPEVVVAVGDRTELLPLASVALVLGVPVAHISGGDTSEGAIDDAVRHAVTKLAHLHFVAMEEHAERVRQLGEEEWRIFVTGDPALDLVHEVADADGASLEHELGIELVPPVVLVTYHPATLGSGSGGIDEVLGGLAGVDATFVLTHPNADVGREAIVRRLHEFADATPRATVHASLGQRAYYRLLARADAMVGNSSSGIWEAPTFALPVVNVGDRQHKRVRAANVVDVREDAGEIRAALERVLSPGFRDSLRGLVNPYGDGGASERIVGTLKRVEGGARLLRKQFSPRT